jgi:hypothetical protein
MSFLCRKRRLHYVKLHKNIEKAIPIINYVINVGKIRNFYAFKSFC